MARRRWSVRLWFIACGCLALGLAGLLAFGTQPISAIPRVQEATIVSPADITTPTPTPLVTPAPAVPANPDPAMDATRVYTVQPGDTLLTVALEIGVNVEEMACLLAPDFTWDQPLVIGDRLALPPASVLCHTVQSGETLASIAAFYGIAPETIYAVDWNQLGNQFLPDAPLAPDLHLRIPTNPAEVRAVEHAPQQSDSPQAFLPWMLTQSIDTSPLVAFAVGGPGGETAAATARQAAVPANWPYGSGHFVWPIYGWLTQGYRFDHRAIDVAANVGTPVTAADRGVVLRAGWNEQGYGLFVIIDHNIDYITLYAHLSEIFVEEGQVVAQGQLLGKVGSTGNSTGPHLHFEIRDFGRLTNPLELLDR